MVFKLNPVTSSLDLVGSAGSGGNANDLTGDVGGAVTGGVADNIDLIGDQTQQFIETTGTPVSNRMEIKIIEPSVDGQLLIGHTSNNEPSTSTITAGSGIVVTNGAGSITIASISTSTLVAPTDSGTATSVGGEMDFFGGTAIDTSGSGNTVTITGTPTIPLSFTTDSGTATPGGYSLAVLGGTNVDTSGSGATLTITATGSYPPSDLSTLYFFDDFIAQTLDTWNGTSAHATATADHAGIAQIGSDSFIALNENGEIIVGGGPVTFIAWAAFSSASPPSGSGAEIFIGLSDSSNNPLGSNRIGFLYDRTLDVNNWHMSCASSSTATNTDTGTAMGLSSNFQELRFVVNAAATSVEFFIDGTSEGTVTTNIPTTAELNLMVVTDAISTSSIRVDAISFLIEYDGVRA